MFLTGEFQLKQPEAAVIAEDAVVRFEGKEYVFVVKGKDQYQIQPVSTAPAAKGKLVLKAQEGIDWKNTELAVKNTYVLLGKLKNKMEEE
jgi:cobalt-zinc-cadmium efflux system membrane fusion protein